MPTKGVGMVAVLDEYIVLATVVVTFDVNVVNVEFEFLVWFCLKPDRTIGVLRIVVGISWGSYVAHLGFDHFTIAAYRLCVDH